MWFASPWYFCVLDIDGQNIGSSMDISEHEVYYLSLKLEGILYLQYKQYPFL